MLQRLRLAARCFHTIATAGRFSHGDTDFRGRYLSPSHAIHLYEYSCRMRWEDEEREIAPGDLTISPSFGATRYHVPQRGWHWCIHFMPQSLDDHVLDLPLHLPMGRGAAHVAERIAHIARLYSHGRMTGSDGPLAQAAAMAALQELLLYLALEATAQGRAPRTRTDAAVEQVAELVAQRFAEPMSVPDLARRVGISQNHLARRFHQRFGMTIPRYILHRRIERARMLLATTDLPIHQVAQVVGMPDAQHFNKQFRRLVGHAPSIERPLTA